MKTAVIGSGGWGTALAMVLADNGHEVALWCRREDKCLQMERTRENPALAGVALPERLRLSAELSAAGGCGAVVLATPSFAVRETVRRLTPFLEQGTILIMASKGIERDTSLRMSQIVRQETGGDFPVVCLSGPSHAEEVGKRIPTGCVSASDDIEAAELVQDLFMSERFRVYASSDIVGVELGAALKNVVALAAGCCDGMGFGDNTKAMLMTRGLTEIARLGVALGGKKETFAGLAGLGDLIVTCTSMHSRNRRAGILIGQGKSPQEAVAEIGAVVEGYYAAANGKALADKAGVEMPITESAYQVLYQGKDVRSVITELMTRAKKHEIEDSWV
ncbi:MAG: Glycerol-3-phosphate dehydrogenase [Oscillospiraceae bacterium]|nr:Glycerol-3-phosphate dehydrogenase [Oscillospiraceae bacterium]